MNEKEFKKYCKEYTIKLLEMQRTKLKCINLGWTKNDAERNVEFELIEGSIKYLKED